MPKHSPALSKTHFWKKNEHMIFQHQVTPLLELVWWSSFGRTAAERPKEMDSADFDFVSKAPLLCSSLVDSSGRDWYPQ